MYGIFRRLLVGTMFLVAIGVVATTGLAVEFWSVDMQGAGGTLYGQEDPPALMDGPDPTFGLGNIWNAFNVAGHDLPAAIDPSLNLVDTDGAVSDVTFSIVGGIAGFSNAPGGHALFKDYAFANAGNSDASLGWSITGLVPGASYNMINYGGVTRTGTILTDMAGDGSLDNDTAGIAPVAAGAIVRGITADANGTILGSFGVGSVAEDNWGGFQLMREQEEVVGTLWSVDIQAVGGIVTRPVPDTMAGVEENYGLGNTWNAFEVNGHDGVSVDPTMDLVDSEGNATSVNFAVYGTASGWSQGPETPGREDLINDYMFANAGNADAGMTWDISGLKPGGLYEMFVYGGIGRDGTFAIDMDGNGSLDNDTSTLVNGAGHLFGGITADANGAIIGSFGEGTGIEANWGGFQLRDISAVPEPGTLALLATGLFGLLIWRRRTV